MARPRWGSRAFQLFGLTGASPPEAKEVKWPHALLVVAVFRWRIDGVLSAERGLGGDHFGTSRTNLLEQALCD